MTKQLVDELRGLTDISNIASLKRRAADEIERLTSALTRLTATLANEGHVAQQADSCCPICVTLNEINSNAAEPPACPCCGGTGVGPVNSNFAGLPCLVCNAVKSGASR